MKETIMGGACLIAGSILLIGRPGFIGYTGLVLVVIGLTLGLSGVLRGKTQDQ